MKRRSQHLTAVAILSLGTSSQLLNAAASDAFDITSWWNWFNNPPVTIEPSFNVGPFSIKPKGLSIKQTLITTVAGWGAWRAYKNCNLTIDIKSLETRLIRLGAAINGLIAKRHADMDCTRSGDFKKQIWALSDQLLELRSHVLHPDFKTYDKELQKTMLDEIDTLLKRTALLEKLKIA